MSSIQNRQFLLIWILISILTIINLSSVVVDGQVSSMVMDGQAASSSEAREKLLNISEEEREVLEKLFTLIQEIERMEGEREEIIKDIDELDKQVIKLEKIVSEETKLYEEKQEDLKVVLRQYQRNGPSSYLKILLESDSLSILLRRINILKDLTHNMGQLLDEIEHSRQNLLMEKAMLAEKLKNIEKKQKQLDRSIASSLKLKDSMEETLWSMGEAREYYEGYLEDIDTMWEDLKLALVQIKKEFSTIIKKDNLPEEAIKMTLTLSGIKVSITEKTFNDIMAEHSSFTELLFRLKRDKVEIIVPEKNLILSGNFKVIGEHILKFEVEEGSFYGFPLEINTLEELFKEWNMALSLKPLIGNNKVRSIRILNGHVELSVLPVLF